MIRGRQVQGPRADSIVSAESLNPAFQRGIPPDLKREEYKVPIYMLWFILVYREICQAH